jgi:excisionase family DNA binding protein
MRLGVCRSTIYNLLNRGELKAVKMGRRTIISDAEIDRLLESLPSWQPRCPQPQDAAS